MFGGEGERERNSVFAQMVILILLSTFFLSCERKNVKLF